MLGGRVEVPSAPPPSRSVARAATGWPRVDDGEPVVAVRSQIRPAGDARRNGVRRDRPFMSRVRRRARLMRLSVPGRDADCYVLRA